MANPVHTTGGSFVVDAQPGAVALKVYRAGNELTPGTQILHLLTVAEARELAAFLSANALRAERTEGRPVSCNAPGAPR